MRELVAVSVGRMPRVAAVALALTTFACGGEQAPAYVPPPPPPPLVGAWNFGPTTTPWKHLRLSFVLTLRPDSTYLLVARPETLETATFDRVRRHIDAVPPEEGRWGIRWEKGRYGRHEVLCFRPRRGVTRLRHPCEPFSLDWYGDTPRLHFGLDALDPAGAFGVLR